MESAFDNRYGSGSGNRAYFISDALIYIRSYTGHQIDRAAEDLNDDEVRAFHKVISTLNRIHDANRHERG